MSKSTSPSWSVSSSRTSTPPPVSAEPASWSVSSSRGDSFDILSGAPQISSPAPSWSVSAARGDSDNIIKEPPPQSLMSQLGGAASGIANATSGIVTGALGSVAGALPGAAGAMINGITGGGISDITSGLSSLASGDIGGGMSSMASAMAKAAGVPGDSASEERGKNIPANGEVITVETAQTPITASKGSDWRVKISAPFSLFKGQNTLLKRLESTGGVVFPYLPTIAISTTANYNTLGFTHNNYPFNAYQNSQVDDITITGQFSCETPSDAEYWLAATLFFRGATKMFFGASAEVGNPPIICKLNGYGAYVFNDVSVVVKNFTVNLPPDVDYVLYEGAEKTWVPILSEISVTVSPIYSREKIRTFSLQDYASGNVGASKGFM